MLIWLATNVLAAGMIAVWSVSSSMGADMFLSGVMDSFMLFLVFGLFFSSPANLFIIPSFYLLDRIPSKPNRITYSVFSILFLCALVIVFFSFAFEMSANDMEELAYLFIPYITSAEICFFLIAHKIILRRDTAPVNDDAGMYKPML